MDNQKNMNKKTAVAVLVLLALAGGIALLVKNNKGTNISQQKAQALPNCPNTGNSIGADGWTTIGHDAERTYASGGCIPGALQEIFTYVPPTPPSGFVFVANSRPRVIADLDKIHFYYPLKVSSNTHKLGMMNQVSLSGVSEWQNLEGFDAWQGSVPAKIAGGAFVSDDGFNRYNYLGGGSATQGGDWWGNIVPDISRSRVYTVNDFDWHGDRIFIAAIPLGRNYNGNIPVWTPFWKHSYPWNPPTGGNTWSGYSDALRGALALDDNTLYWARSFNHIVDATWPWESGITAFNPDTGSQTWFVPASPTNSISVNDNYLYSIENALVARNKTDGSVAWTVPAQGTVDQGPLLAPGMVLLATTQGIFAYNSTTGAPLWNTPLPISSSYADSVAAIALSSNTVVVTGTTNIYVLSLTDGTILWSGRPASLVGTPYSPVIVGNRVYIIDSVNTTGKFIALEATGVPAPTLPTDNTPPFSVSITYPPAGWPTVGIVSFFVSAYDEVGVTSVKLYRDSTYIADMVVNDPFSYNWDTSGVPNGTYAITAKAFDAAGNFATSSPLTVTVNNASTTDTTPPTVSLTAPLNGANVSGTITLTATASDASGIAHVDFYKGTTLLNSDTTSPYSYAWNTTSSDNGSYALTAKAFDTIGNNATSNIANVTVANVVAATPTVTITSPAGTTVSGTKVNFTATATLSSSISLSVDGAPKKTCNSATSCTYNWNVKQLPVGSTHTLTATATNSNPTPGTATKIVTKT